MNILAGNPSWLLVCNTHQRSFVVAGSFFSCARLRMSRYGVFIDGGYARKISDNFNNVRVSYTKFSDLVANGQERLRTYYYDCPPFVSSRPSQPEKDRKAGFDRFTARLEKESRFQVRLGRLAKRHNDDGGVRYEQKMVDILLAVDLVQLSVEHQIQRAILLANDSDFVPAIEIARNAGTVVELYYLEQVKPHTQLQVACDDCFPINQELVDQITL